jgi:hypothetical protein
MRKNQEHLFRIFLKGFMPYLKRADVGVGPIVEAQNSKSAEIPLL